MTLLEELVALHDKFMLGDIKEEMLREKVTDLVDDILEEKTVEEFRAFLDDVGFDEEFLDIVNQVLEHFE